MTFLYLMIGILAVAFAFDYSATLGAALLIVIVLGMWLTAYKKGVFA